MARARHSAHNAPGVLTPQGRLTLTTATPVMAAEAASQQTIYYTPYVGDRVALYNGTEWENKLFTELSIALAASANWAAASIFDVFVYNDAGTLRLVTGAAWTNSTTRSEALVRTNGLWLNNASFTGRYAAGSTVSIAASRATYVGTFRTTTQGVTTWELGGTTAGGDAALLHVWNAYNRVNVYGQSADDTASWTYASATIRAANAGSYIYVSIVSGLAEDGVDLHAMIRIAETANHYAFFGISKNTTSAQQDKRSLVYSAGGVAVDGQYPVVMHDGPMIGYHYYYLTESGDNTTYTAYSGGAKDCYISIVARA